MLIIFIRAKSCVIINVWGVSIIIQTVNARRRNFKCSAVLIKLFW
jgi:hypothetical protein